MNKRFCSAIALALLVAVPSALLANDEPDEPIPGKMLVVRAERLVKVVGRPSGGDLALPAVGNPTVDGATIRFFDTVTFPGGGAGDVTYDLDASGWKGLGRPAGSKGFEYRGKDAVPADDVCKLVILKPKVIKAVCRGTAVEIPFAPPFLGPAGVILTVGTSSQEILHGVRRRGEEKRCEG